MFYEKVEIIFIVIAIYIAWFVGSQIIIVIICTRSGSEVFCNLIGSLIAGY